MALPDEASKANALEASPTSVQAPSSNMHEDVRLLRSTEKNGKNGYVSDPFCSPANPNQIGEKYSLG